MFSSLFRQLKFALQNFSRNIWLSLAIIIVIILSLFSINILLTLNALTNQAINIIKEKINISLYFQPDTNINEINKIKQDLLNIQEVKEVKYITKETAMEEFQKTHQDNPLLIRSLEELDENPLSDSLIITAEKTEDYQKIISFLNQPDYENLISNKKFNEDYQGIIDNLNQTSKNIQLIMLGIICLFIFIAVLIIVNTIRIGIYTFRGEIEIMRLVGAKNSFIRSPFLWQGIFYGLLAWVIHLIIFFPIISALQPYISNFLGSEGFNAFQYFHQHLLTIAGCELMGVLILNILVSSLTIRKYLKT